MLYTDSKTLLVAMALISFVGCGRVSPTASHVSARQMTTNEALADFDEIASSVRTLYGPLEYKEARFGFKFEDVVQEFRTKIQNAKTDDEFFGLYAQFLTRLQDAHVSVGFSANASGIKSYNIGLFLVPVEGKAVVGFIASDLADQGIAAGDEVVSVDGANPFDLLKTIVKYRSNANDISDQHQISKIFARPTFMIELKPTSAFSHIEFKSKDGKTYSRDLTWHQKLYSDIPDKDLIKDKGAVSGRAVIESGLKIDSEASPEFAGNPYDMGAIAPFFATDAVLTAKGMIRVTANETYLKAYNLDPASNPEVFAALYQHQGKLVLLVRQPTYAHNPPEKFSNKDYMNAYRAILDQYDSVAQVLVIDQTHNGGGSYCEDFFRLFIQKPEGAFVQRLHADRKWMVDLREWTPTSGTSDATEDERAAFALANLVESTYDAGKAMTDDAVPLMNSRNMVDPDKAYTWKKPFLVLVDEMSASCADAFPSLVKRAGVAPLFGERTMGAGGNVEQTLTTSNSRAKPRLTRGLFTSFKPSRQYEPSDWVENNGVVPDIAYKHTLEDFRAGFVKYVDTFSDSAIALIK